MVVGLGAIAGAGGGVAAAEAAAAAAAAKTAASSITSMGTASQMAAPKVAAFGAVAGNAASAVGDFVRQIGGVYGIMFTQFIPSIAAGHQNVLDFTLSLTQLNLKSEQLTGSIDKLYRITDKYARATGTTRREVSQFLIQLDSANRYGLDLDETLGNVVNKLDKLAIPRGDVRKGFTQDLMHTAQQYGQYPTLLKDLQEGKGVPKELLTSLTFRRDRSALQQLLQAEKLLTGNKKDFEGIRGMGPVGTIRSAFDTVGSGYGRQWQGVPGEGWASPVLTGSALVSGGFLLDQLRRGKATTALSGLSGKTVLGGKLPLGKLGVGSLAGFIGTSTGGTFGEWREQRLLESLGENRTFEQEKEVKMRAASLNIGTGMLAGGVSAFALSGGNPVVTLLGTLVPAVMGGFKWFKEKDKKEEKTWQSEIQEYLKQTQKLEKIEGLNSIQVDILGNQTSYFKSLVNSTQTFGRNIEKNVSYYAMMAEATREVLSHLIKNREEDDAEGKLNPDQRLKLLGVEEDTRRQIREYELSPFKEREQLAGQKETRLSGLLSGAEQLGALPSELVPYKLLQAEMIKERINAEKEQLKLAEDSNSIFANEIKNRIQQLELSKRNLEYQANIEAKYQTQTKLLDAQSNIYSTMQSIAQQLQFPWTVQVSYAEQLAQLAEIQLQNAKERYALEVKTYKETGVGAQKVLDAQKLVTSAATEYASKLDYTRKTLFDIIKEEVLTVGGTRTGLVSGTIAEGAIKGPSWYQGAIAGSTEGRPMGLQWQQVMHRQFGTEAGQANVFQNLMAEMSSDLKVLNLTAVDSIGSTLTTSERHLENIANAFTDGGFMDTLFGKFFKEEDIAKSSTPTTSVPTSTPTTSVPTSTPTTSVPTSTDKYIPPHYTQEEANILREQYSKEGKGFEGKGRRISRAMSAVHGMQRAGGNLGELLIKGFSRDSENIISESREASKEHTVANKVGSAAGSIAVGGASSAGLGTATSIGGAVSHGIVTGGTTRFIGEAGRQLSSDEELNMGRLGRETFEGGLWGGIGGGLSYKIPQIWREFILKKSNAETVTNLLPKFEQYSKAVSEAGGGNASVTEFLQSNWPKDVPLPPIRTTSDWHNLVKAIQTQENFQLQYNPEYADLVKQGLRPPPSFHEGGMYRAPTLGGEGLALLKDREIILPPEKIGRASSTVDLTGAKIIVQLGTDGKDALEGTIVKVTKKQFV